jgi:hypothetical protein
MGWIDWRGWLARKLLEAANRVDPDCRVMCDQRAGWIFRRGWTPPIGGGASS